MLPLSTVPIPDSYDQQIENLHFDSRRTISNSLRKSSRAAYLSMAVQANSIQEFSTDLLRVYYGT